MQIRDIFIEIGALALVILILVGLPIIVWWYEEDYLPSSYPEGTKIVNLTAKVNEEECLWTRDAVNGFNYWWKDFRFADEIPATEGEKIIFRIKSADVLHSFAIPRFRIGPLEVEAGKVKEVEFDAVRTGDFKYLCWLWCSDCHGDLKGKIVVNSR
jgi:heme/copper-type cytochrome/quinol oxidase subunit 2